MNWESQPKSEWSATSGTFHQLGREARDLIEVECELHSGFLRWLNFLRFMGKIVTNEKCVSRWSTAAGAHWMSEDLQAISQLQMF